MYGHAIGKFEEFYMNALSVSILQIFKKCYDEYKNKISPSNSHIYIRACDDESSFHCPYPIIRSKIQNGTTY